MKKRNLLLSLATALCVSCAFTGCSSEDEGNNSNNSTKASNEATTAAKDDAEENSIIGYWAAEGGMAVYYHIEEDSMEVLTMGQVMTIDIELSDDVISSTTEGMDMEYGYSVDGDVLTLMENDESIELNRITEEDFDSAVKLASGDGEDDEDDTEDPGVYGYVVEPGVQMTVTLDDGTILILANDGDGTYIKSSTPPADEDDTEDTTEDTTENTSEEETSTEQDTPASSTTTERHQAFQNNVYFTNRNLPMSIEDLRKELGEPTQAATEDRNWDTWMTSDNFMITAFHKNGVVWQMTVEPKKLDAWATLNVDFSTLGIDENKSYTYEELSKIIGSAGIVNKMSYIEDIDKYEYTIVWYNKDFDLLYATFDMNTNMTTYVGIPQ